MRSLQRHHITDLFVQVATALPPVAKPRGGRPAVLADSELVTILLWNVLTVSQKTLKGIYQWVIREYAGEFPRLPVYSTFVEHCHRLVPTLLSLLGQLLQVTAPIRLMDSTMLPVCRLVRADRHRVAKTVAAFGKNHQGWHYGFKLHASITTNGQFCGLALTPADVHDAQMMPRILNRHTQVAVGDGAYTASVMRRIIWQRYGTLVVSPPHYKQTRKLMTAWQHTLLKVRPRIEAVFGYLKEHLGLVSSFPRSVKGYLLHYARVLLGYQVMTG